MESTDLSIFHYEDLFQCLEPETALERIKYRKNVGNDIGGKRKFLVMRGVVGQAEHLTENLHQMSLNNEFGFKCLHYSVTESSGHIEVTIKKKAETDVEVGVRTCDDTAISPKDYVGKDEIVHLKVEETTFYVKVVDDEFWNPDNDFFIELYDPNTGMRHQGDDTKCKVTILDEDQPGVLGFEERHIKVRRKDKKVFIKVVRLDGSSGEAKCKIQTEVI